MEKSVILSIFLMSSLLMSTSSAVLTYNVNLLSNTAMAQEYGNNNYNNYNDSTNTVNIQPK